MSFHLHRPVFVIIVLGCLLPVFALTRVTFTDGSVLQGTVVSEESDFFVLNVDGKNTTIYRSMIQGIENDPMEGAGTSDASSSYEPQPSQVSQYNTVQTAAPAPQQYAAAAPAMETAAPVPEQISTRQRVGRETREKVSIGLDLGFTTSSNVFNDDAAEMKTSTSRSTYSLNPYVGIRRSDILELRPSLLFGLYKYSRTTKIEGSSLSSSSSSSTKQTRDSSFVSIGFDFGVFFYPVRGNFFRIALGPTLGYAMQFAPRAENDNGTTTTELEYDRYVDITIPLTVPFSFDFIVSEHLGLRLSSQLYGFSLNINSVEGPGSSTDYTNVSTDSALDFTKMLTELRLGIMLLF